MIKTKKIILNFYWLLIISLIFLAVFLFFALKPKSLQFYVFDVGQGDAIFIQTPGGYNILVDGGPDNSVIYKLGKYLPFYDRQIDLMILTHPHSDHIVGLNEVLNRYKVKRIYTTGVYYYSSDYLAWLKKIEEKDIPIEIIYHAGSLILNDKVKLEILFPDINLQDKKLKNINNASIVARVVYNDKSILLTGDYEDEEKLINKNYNIMSNILKVGHHGSNTANSLEFLKALNPDSAIISCGKDNKFNHPHQQTLNIFDRLNVDLFRTDLNGDIILKF